MSRVREGTLAKLLGPTVREVGSTRVLLVTDPGVRQAGHCETALDSLTRSGIAVRVFDRVRANPMERDVERCARFALEAQVDGFVVVGGGSCIDTAKGANFLITNGGAMRDYWGFDKAKRPLLPLVVAPTTAGTGSEVQSYALIGHDESHAKMACGAPSALPAYALLDPGLTVTLPREQTAITGLDALVHAVETYVCSKRTDRSMALSRDAFSLLIGSFVQVLACPNDLKARGAMLRGACYAGQAIESSMLGAAHAAANPLTATFDVPHGVAVALMLPHVIRFNRAVPLVADLYDDLAGLGSGAPLDAQMEAMLEHAQVGTLASYGVTKEAVALLSKDAAAQWTGQFNPRALQVGDFAALYQAALAS